MGLVEFRDGSVVAQLGAPDMRMPIAHCLAWPQPIDGPAPRLDLAQIGESDLRGARSRSVFRRWRWRGRRLQAGGAAPTVLNAANEVAVGEFIAGRIGFTGIAALVEATLEAAAARGLMAEPARHRCRARR